MVLPTGCGWLPCRTVILQECFPQPLPTDLLPSFLEILTLPASSYICRAPLLPSYFSASLPCSFSIWDHHYDMACSGIEACFKVYCKHFMISLMIIFPLIEKRPHQNEWLWKARCHKHISKGPASSVLLWPQADGLESCVAPSLGHFLSCPLAGLSDPGLGVQTVCDGVQWPGLTQVFSPCHPK